jgi:glutamine amidotransferase
MSPFAAYIGPAIPLQEFLFEPPQNLLWQSRNQDKSLKPGPSADGFGLGWYNNSGPQRYIQTCPIWGDSNLGAIATSLIAPFWLGSVRNAEGKFGVIPANTQPFQGEGMLFSLNGFVKNFNQVLRPACLEYLSLEMAASIQGNTDSEYLFALLRQHLMESERFDLGEALIDILSNLMVSLKEGSAILNLIVSDGRRIFAARQAINQPSPPIFYCEEDKFFPPGARLIATHPLTNNPHWQEVPEYHMLVLEQDRPAQLVHF